MREFFINKKRGKGRKKRGMWGRGGRGKEKCMGKRGHKLNAIFSKSTNCLLSSLVEGGVSVLRGGKR